MNWSWEITEHGRKQSEKVTSIMDDAMKNDQISQMVKGEWCEDGQISQIMEGRTEDILKSETLLGQQGLVNAWWGNPIRNSKFGYRDSKSETCGEKAIRVGFNLRGHNGGEREVIKVNGRTGMGNGEEEDKRDQLRCWSACLSPAPDHHNPSYVLIQLTS